VNKPKAIIISDILPSQCSVLEEILLGTDLTIISKGDIAGTQFEQTRFFLFNQLLDTSKIREQANIEANARRESLANFLTTRFKQLPYATDIPEVELQEVETTLHYSLVEMLFCTFAIEALTEKYDIRCFVCNWSFLAENQAMIAYCQANGIPTLHIEHGAWTVPQTERPEPADYVAIADQYALEVFNLSKTSPAMAVVTGIPTNTLKVSDSDKETPKINLEQARQTLGLSHLTDNSTIILYASSWREGLYLSSACYAHKLVEAYEKFLLAVKKLQDSGKDVHVIVRQHPSIKKFESELAYTSIADSYGVENLVVNNEHKDACLTACDIVVSPLTQTSFVLDTFAFEKPFLSLNHFPVQCARHPIAENMIVPLIEMASSCDAIHDKLLLLIENSTYRAALIQKGTQFFAKKRSFNARAATENISLLIQQLSKTEKSTSKHFSPTFIEHS